MIDFSQHRNEDGSINLIDAWTKENFSIQDMYKITNSENRIPFANALDFLSKIQEKQPIKSRQVAALALVQADIIFNQR